MERRLCGWILRTSSQPQVCPRPAMLNCKLSTNTTSSYNCHSRVAGRTRETRGKRNNGILITEHRIHYHIDELTDKDSGKTQGLWTHNNHGKQHQVRSKSNTDGDEWTNDRKQEGPYKGVETQGKGRQSLTIMHSAADYGSWLSPKRLSSFCSWVCMRSYRILSTN